MLAAILLLLCCTMTSAQKVVIDGIAYHLVTKAKNAKVTNNPSKYSDSITIPSKVTYNDVTYSVTAIGEYAFTGCINLTSIAIPNSVTSIERGAFSWCTGLTNIEIPNGVTSIGHNAFSGCAGLTSITIPNNVTSIEHGTFSWCRGLTSIEIPNGVTSIGHNAFSECSRLRSIEVPNSVTSIGERAFFECSDLTSITIPGNVTIIEDWVFYGCTDLTSITIPKSVTSIGNGAFKECTGLTDVYCLATSVPSIESNVFSDSHPQHLTLHIPAEAINSYRAIAPWSKFGTIVALTGNETEEPTVIKCATPTLSYASKISASERTIANGKAMTETTVEKGENAIIPACGKSVKAVAQ